MSVSTLMSTVVVTIRIPASLRRFADERHEVVVDAIDVDGALNALVRDYPRLQPQLFTPDGTLRRFVNVFLNMQDIRHLDGGATVLAGRDEIMLLPALAGG